MHKQVLVWLEHTKAGNPAVFQNGRVLECGSYAERDWMRPYFDNCEYTGLDCRPGPGVDVVGLAHEYRDADGFDVVISAQMLEHDPHWRESVANMARLVRRGGALMLTWAGANWPEHDGGGPGWSHYCNLLPEEVVAAMDGHYWQHVIISSHFRDYAGPDGGVGLCLLALNKLA